MAILKIKNLLLRSIVGFNPHEIGKKQDVLINITIEYSSGKEELSDSPNDALDYKSVSKLIIEKVEKSKFNLLEALARMILDTVMDFERVENVSVEVDKLHALRFAESVSFSLYSDKHLAIDG